MRNWNPYMCHWLWFHAFPFLQYLWGIETNSCIHKSNFLTAFLQYLWGIETCSGPRIHFSLVQVFTVPMRNWNYTSTKKSKTIYLSFLQYLWGIETFGLNIKKVFNLRFYSTYEELKHSHNRVSDYCINRFYSTYEELKHLSRREFYFIFFSFLQYLWGIETSATALVSLAETRRFYSTYEELKRVITWVRSFIKVSVFTVPMRNWNLEKYQVLCMEKAVFTVPMRNWNHFSSIYYYILISSFYSTYEELKQSELISPIL